MSGKGTALVRLGIESIFPFVRRSGYAMNSLNGKINPLLSKDGNPLFGASNMFQNRFGNGTNLAGETISEIQVRTVMRSLSDYEAKIGLPRDPKYIEMALGTTEEVEQLGELMSTHGMSPSSGAAISTSEFGFGTFVAYIGNTISLAATPFYWASDLLRGKSLRPASLPKTMIIDTTLLPKEFVNLSVTQSNGVIPECEVALLTVASEMVAVTCYQLGPFRISIPLKNEYYMDPAFCSKEFTQDIFKPYLIARAKIVWNIAKHLENGEKGEASKLVDELVKIKVEVHKQYRSQIELPMYMKDPRSEGYREYVVKAAKHLKDNPLIDAEVVRESLYKRYDLDMAPAKGTIVSKSIEDATHQSAAQVMYSLKTKKKTACTEHTH